MKGRVGSGQKTREGRPEIRQLWSRQKDHEADQAEMGAAAGKTTKAIGRKPGAKKTKAGIRPK
jgi:hypothetical protein